MKQAEMQAKLQFQQQMQEQKMQAEQQKLQMKGAQTQQKMEADRQKLQADVQAKQVEAQGKIQGHVMSVQMMREHGHAAVVSGAGPSVLVLATGPAQRLEAAALAAKRSCVFAVSVVMIAPV